MNLKNLSMGGAEINSTAANIGLFILRVFAGLSLALAHGLGKFPPSERFITSTGELGFPLPIFFAWAASFSELVGGFLVALGLFTRVGAFFASCTMATAGFLRHMNDPWGQKEKAFLFLAIFVALIFIGAGKYSLDAVWRKK